ncbi:hypothetical protein SLEP1_g33578 [Rubroshorea leprosula]|uniref:Uncharacterized protein n=1 Tax=Rubroshorea leprosula TaxID=152421 RepID=A0AAV5KH75_9ROSI|nr:hypothetical protein SLEP1_g33578 [Rubroshorea leprosula]
MEWMECTAAIYLWNIEICPSHLVRNRNFLVVCNEQSPGYGVESTDLEEKFALKEEDGAALTGFTKDVQ